MKNAPGPFDEKPTRFRFLRRRPVAFALAMALLFVLAIGLLMAMGGMNPVTQLQQFFTTRRVMREIREREEFERNDTYGGKTPEETYGLFLQALEKQDIDLSSKYFVKEKQDEIKQRLSKILENGKWQLMYSDLSGETTKIEYEQTTESWYEIKIRGQSGDLVAVLRTEKYSAQGIWKLTQFF